nr:hypothetical protein [uncultured Agathobaculum sp.]
MRKLDRKYIFYRISDVPRVARTSPGLQKVPQSETFRSTGIKTHAHVAGFYEHCGMPQCSVGCALRASDKALWAQRGVSPRLKPWFQTKS